MKLEVLMEWKSFCIFFDYHNIIIEYIIFIPGGDGLPATGFDGVGFEVEVADDDVLDFRLPRAANGSNPAPNMETPPIGFLGFATAGASSISFSSSSSSSLGCCFSMAFWWKIK